VVPWLFFSWETSIAYGAPMTESLDNGTARRAFVRALHESTAIADRIRAAIADAPPKLVMLALSDLLQEHLTRLMMVEPDREQTPLSPLCECPPNVLS
jgi:hypothetical protein